MERHEGKSMKTELRFGVCAIGLHVAQVVFFRLVEWGWVYPNVGFSLAAMTLGSNSFPFVATLLIFCLFIRLIRMPEGEMRRAGCSLEGRLISLPTCNTHYTLLEPDSPKLPQSTPGSLVVIVHGYSGDVSHTIALGRELRRAGYRVLLYDLVGRGYSSCRNYDHTASLFVSQLCELLLALELNEQRLHLVGISLGGGVCAEYAKYFPKNVASMTLIASVGLPLCSSVHILTKLPLLPDFLFRFAPQHTLVAGLEHEWADSQNLKYDLMLESYMARVQSEPAFARSMLSTARHFPLEGLENTFRRVGRMFDKSALNRPTLLVWGDEDRTCPVANARRMHSELLPNSQLKIVKGARHCVYTEFVGDVAHGLVQFLREHSPANDAAPKQAR